MTQTQIPKFAFKPHYEKTEEVVFLEDILFNYADVLYSALSLASVINRTPKKERQDLVERLETLLKTLEKTTPALETLLKVIRE